MNFLKKVKVIYNSNPTLLVLAIIAIGTIIRLIIAAYTGLGIGEAYYFRGAKDIQLGYYDQPPLFFWADHIFLRLFSISNFALRFTAVLFFAGTEWFLYKITSRIYNPKAGLWAVVVLNICMVFTVPIATWFQPDAPLMFFWLLTIYLLVRILEFGQVQQNSSNYYLLWFFTGVSLGLTFLSKYHALFIPMGVGIFIILNPAYRRWIFHPAPYLAMIPFLLIALPVILWNRQNDWVSFTFQGSRAVGQFKIHPEWLLRNILGQIVWLAPWIFIPLFKEMLRLGRSVRTDSKSAFLFYLAVCPIAFFTIISLWSNSKYHFHWQAPGYLLLMIPLGETIREKINDPLRGKKAIRWIKNSAIASIVISAVLLVHTETGFVKKLTGLDKNPGIIKMDPTIEGYDYTDIKTRFDKEGWSKNDSIFVVSTTWWQAGKIDWALKGKKDFIILSSNPRNYTFYGTDPVKLLGKDAILIRYFRENNTENDFKEFFRKTETISPIFINRCGINELKLQTFYCSHFQIPDSAMHKYPVYNLLQGLKPFSRVNNTQHK